LLSYGIDPVDNFRRAASYVDRILGGEKPAELPVLLVGLSRVRVSPGADLSNPKHPTVLRTHFGSCAAAQITAVHH
jgi:hypothetical protein